MRVRVHKPSKIEGSLIPPGDKSISHRAAILNAVAEGTATIQNFSTGADCASTIRCLRALGVSIRTESLNTPSSPTHHQLIVQGVGSKGLKEPTTILNAGNSGTTIRFLSGLLASQPLFSVITGDRSLRSRPMIREVIPLRAMGAEIWARGESCLAPMALYGRTLHNIDYSLPEASAQLKSTLLLAGLFGKGDLFLHQPSPSRDHTEHLLQAMGAAITVDGLSIHLIPGPLQALDVTVPADISAAAFWLVTAMCHPQAHFTLRGVGINPSRAGILEVLEMMGGHILRVNPRQAGGEPVADLIAETTQLQAVDISGDLIPSVIDEIPILALAACFAKGTTTIRDAAALRVKESDRISTTVQALASLGAEIQELPDGMVIRGTGKLKGTSCKSHGDHRLAMTLGIAGLLAEGTTQVDEAQAVSISYPAFWHDLAQITPEALEIS